MVASVNSASPFSSALQAFQSYEEGLSKFGSFAKFNLSSAKMSASRRLDFEYHIFEGIWRPNECLHLRECLREALQILKMSHTKAFASIIVSNKKKKRFFMTS